MTATAALCLAPSLTMLPSERPIVEMPVVLAIVMTAVSMYVSSLCATAVRAVVTSVAALSFVLWLVLEPKLWTGREPSSSERLIEVDN